MAKKPRKEELEDEELFEYVEVRVPVYRRKSDDNLFFIDHEGTVLDRYVTVRDVDGVPFISRRKSGIEGLGSKLARGAIAVFAADKLSIPMGIARRLLNVAKEDSFTAQGIRAAVDLVRNGEERRGAMLLLDALGPSKWQSMLDGWYSLTGEMTVSDFRRELELDDEIV